MNTFDALLNKVVRGYLAYFPVTDGKKYVLRCTKQRIMPEQSMITFRTKHGFDLRVNLRNVEHQRMYFYGEHDERYEIRNLKRILRPGDTCWDIGANIGFYTCLFASLVGEAGRVVAFEPASRTAALLRENIELNHTTHRVVVLDKAIGNVVGRQRIFFQAAEMAEGTASLRKKRDGEAEWVDVDSLDNLRMVLPVPDLIKIDVEGYHAELFVGGATFFAHHSPMMMAELKDDDPTRVCAVENKLRGWGYLIYEFKKRSLVRCDNIARSKARNFFLIRSSSKYWCRINALQR